MITNRSDDLTNQSETNESTGIRDNASDNRTKTARTIDGNFRWRRDDDLASTTSDFYVLRMKPVLED